jgi:hypothetical protein
MSALEATKGREKLDDTIKINAGDYSAKIVRRSLFMSNIRRVRHRLYSIRGSIVR